MARNLPAVVKSDQSLVKLTPLQLYLREISNYALLTAEEEHQLAVAHFEQGDVEAAHRLITANLRLVVKIANDFKQVQTNLLDLIQEGNYGLMQAVKKFNPYKGVKLSSYSAWWIRAFILKYIMDNRSQVRMGTTRAQRKLFFNLRKEAERLLQVYERVDPKMIAANLQVKERDVIEMQQRIDSPDVSLDAVEGEEDGNRSLLNLLPQASEDLEETVALAQLRAKFSRELIEFRQTLNDRELTVLDERVLSDTPLTLQALADRYGVTRERARQLEARLLKNLRKFIAARGVIDIDEQGELK